MGNHGDIISNIATKVWCDNPSGKVNFRSQPSPVAHGVERASAEKRAQLRSVRCSLVRK